MTELSSLDASVALAQTFRRLTAPADQSFTLRQIVISRCGDRVHLTVHLHEGSTVWDLTLRTSRAHAEQVRDRLIQVLA